MDKTQAAIAKRMINASICAYQIHPQGWKPTPGTLHPPVARTEPAPNGKSFYNVVPTYQDAVGFVADSASYTPLWVATGEDQIDAALVGAMADGNLLVSLRGTIPPSFENNDLFSWMADWLEDADITPRSWWYRKAPYIRDCKVGSGFAIPMLKLWPSIAQMIEQTITAHSCTGVIVTGHSKGAAMSFLAATLIESSFPQFKGNIQVHAFAPPVTGNDTFKKFYGQLEQSTHRYQVEHDIVPFLPIWTDADIWPQVVFSKLWMEAAWAAFVIGIDLYTEGGYTAVGDFTYFDSSHQLVPNADVHFTAMPAVVSALEKEKFSEIAAAHSAVSSYLPCFQ